MVEASFRSWEQLQRAFVQQAARMCSMHGCCDHGIHSERNTPNFRHGPDRGRQSRDSMFGTERAQTTVSQPREVTRLSSRPDRSDRRENTRSDNSMHARGSDRRDNSLHSRSDNSMNARVSDVNSNSKHVILPFLSVIWPSSPSFLLALGHTEINSRS